MSRTNNIQIIVDIVKTLSKHGQNVQNALVLRCVKPKRTGVLGFALSLTHSNPMVLSLRR